MNFTDIEKLEKRLSGVLPEDRDGSGCYGTDGSHEALLDLYEDAFEKAVAIAEDAIRLLRRT